MLEKEKHHHDEKRERDRHEEEVHHHRRSNKRMNEEETAEPEKQGRKRPRRSRSRTRSRSPYYYNRWSNRRRSRSHSPYRRRSHSPYRNNNYRARPLFSTSMLMPYGNNRKFYDGRQNPAPCDCLGIFGMSLVTTEHDLRRIFSRYGHVDKVHLVCDRYIARSRGYAFVYFTRIEDATRARECMQDVIIDGCRVRVDYSVTQHGGPTRHRYLDPRNSHYRY